MHSISVLYFLRKVLDLDELSIELREKFLSLYELCTERIQTSMIAMKVCICSRVCKRMSFKKYKIII